MTPAGDTRRILVIGGGIGGLTAAIALRERGFSVEVIERDPDWSVYGVGIIQQANVIRAMDRLGVLDDYLEAGSPFDRVDVFLPSGQQVASVPTPRLVDDYPANIGIGRRALHKVLGDATIAAGAQVRLGLTAEALADDGTGVDARFSDGSTGRYDIVVGADGLYSHTRGLIFPDTPPPRFAGQGVWRYNLPGNDIAGRIAVFEGPTGVGLVPISPTQMYMYVTTPEPGNPRYPREGLAAAMRAKLAGVPAPQIQALAATITDDAGVVYKPLETLFLHGPWHKGRIVLLGDAVHSTTPHLGQGAGMAIEDGLVLAETLADIEDTETAFAAYRARRFDRCRYIVEASIAICTAQIEGRRIDQAAATREMFEIVAQPI